ncbi:hypothetical protein NE865_01681 [Phthorimaea operculella]|nr:hypothetical protein NE865_13577 [Phthorimaea operculella]KAI5646219.1 hypothetical protein NE865_01681 [Phthorimaea operculella]
MQHTTGDPADYTLKHYYYPIDVSDEETSANKIAPKRKNKDKDSASTNSIDSFFENPKKKKKQSTFSSSVGQTTNDGMAYITTNEDDSSHATHFIKIEIYDIAKIPKDTPPTEHWKYANVRVKYCVHSEDDKNYQQTREIIYNITKQIATKSDCKKFFVDHKK